MFVDCVLFCIFEMDMKKMMQFRAWVILLLIHLFGILFSGGICCFVNLDVFVAVADILMYIWCYVLLLWPMVISCLYVYLDKNVVACGSFCTEMLKLVPVWYKIRIYMCVMTSDLKLVMCLVGSIQHGHPKLECITVYCRNEDMRFKAVYIHYSGQFYVLSLWVLVT